MVSDAQWTNLEPLVEACRPKGKTQPKDLRRTLSAIIWRHANGAKWRAIPTELGPWSRAAQMFIRWAHLGVWERLLLLAQERGVQLGMTFVDGTSIRAHHKAAGAEKRGPPARRAMSVRRWAVRAVGMECQWRRDFRPVRRRETRPRQAIAAKVCDQRSSRLCGRMSPQLGGGSAASSAVARVRVAWFSNAPAARARRPFECVRR